MSREWGRTEKVELAAAMVDGKKWNVDASVSAVGGWLYVAEVRESNERKRYGGKKRVAIVAKWRE